MIADRIRELREKNGYTQSVLAKKLGITRSAENAWEMGINIPSAQNIVELSKIFKVSTDYILAVDHQETIDISSLTNEEKAIIYSLLNCFNQYRGYDSIKKEFCMLRQQQVKLPDGIQELFEKVLE